MKNFLTVILIAAPFSYSQVPIASPQLKCGDNLGKNVCFRHSATNPVTFMRYT